MPTNVVILQGDISQLKVDTIVPVDRIGTREAYREALRAAAARHSRSIAFPDGTGLSGDRPAAVRIALAEVRDFLIRHPNAFSEIIFACWDTENYHLYKEMLGGENRMIDIPT